MKPIVAPTDFSAISLNAVNYAADMACRLDIVLHLLHVYTVPVIAGEIPVAAVMLQDLETDARSRLDKLADKLIDRTGGQIEIRIEARPGNVLQEIVSYCQKAKPYAVVMGAESASAFERVFFGGKTLEALKLIQWPLIIVPPGMAFKNLRKVGFACDFREVVESVRSKEIRDIVEEFNAELHILHVSDEAGGSLSPEMIEESGRLQEMLGDLHPRYHFLTDSNIEKTLNEYAEKNDLDLLIVAPKKHSLADKVFKGSHSRRVVLHTHVPVMAIHE